MIHACSTECANFYEMRKPLEKGLSKIILIQLYGSTPSKAKQKAKKQSLYKSTIKHKSKIDKAKKMQLALLPIKKKICNSDNTGTKINTHLISKAAIF